MNPRRFVLGGAVLLSIVATLSIFLVLKQTLQNEEMSLHSIKSNETMFKTIRFGSTVQSAIDNLDVTRVQDFVRHFSSYPNRYYRSESGVESQEWLLYEVLSSFTSYKGNYSVSEMDHEAFPQKSIIARLEGADAETKDQVVILGAHLDSFNVLDSDYNAPGADDNASGCVAILEALRNIIQTGFIPKRTLEFHWYAAEENGFLGSLDIVENFLQLNVTVAGMLNFDSVSYHEEGVDEIGVYTDYGNESVEQFLRILTDEYLSYTWRNMTCGYSCSDHVSWTNEGYPAAMASTVTWNPFEHTAQDTIDKVNFPQLQEFIKLAISFAIEVSEPSNLEMG